MALQTEQELTAWLLYMHVSTMVERLRQIPEDKWDWSFSPAAPSARTLGIHAWQWLVCDRQHITEPDALQHAAVPEPPESQQAMCDLLQQEVETWRTLILRLSPEQLLEPRRQFNNGELNIRWFIGHMVQNCIYKNGQLATIYFALGLDGNEPYSAPFPNPIYEQLRLRDG